MVIEVNVYIAYIRLDEFKCMREEKCHERDNLKRKFRLHNDNKCTVLVISLLEHDKVRGKPSRVVPILMIETNQ